MRTSAFLILALVACSAFAIDDVEVQFQGFMKEHNKNHQGAEYSKRLNIFRDNLKRIEEHKKNDPTATHGVTQFADLTHEEFIAQFAGMRGAPKMEGIPIRENFKGGAPDSFDWRSKGAVTPVKNQGSCGSCWSFSTTGNVEGAWYLAKNQLVSLSEQNLVDCDHQCDPSGQACDAGCNGGLPTNAFEYIMKNGGIDTEESYPYQGVDGTCKFNQANVGATISNYTRISTDEEAIKEALYEMGPLSIGINAMYMQFYMGGTSCPWVCGDSLDHGVLITGYGTEGFSVARMSKMDYWTIKNSWGETWGEKGYYRICRGKGMCGVNQMVASAIV
eukprot:CAMPEP_0113879292 /NCGR_PEP_ID=MMETSP0780_2-20120614/7160_1 /TAXON_ID=652834 /ORGANISM="Palpitomonas bilix" /LENGTH=331 /DNA_ID=CAMNT_0000865863 /DNA_START=107 /DNA_END=1102 /DNA_ORIENTATION=+ /assembly_acc=CAM_ASM_000599